MGFEGRHQRRVAFGGQLIGVDGVRRHEADAAVTVHVVIPTEEHLAVSPRVLMRCRWTVSVMICSASSFDSRAPIIQPTT